MRWGELAALIELAQRAPKTRAEQTWLDALVQRLNEEQRAAAERPEPEQVRESRET